MNIGSTQSKLIYNAVALKSAKQLHNSTWNIHGSIQIPFCEDRQILLNEFKKLSESILNAAFQTEYRLVWIINIIDGESWLDGDGNVVKSFSKIHFLIGDAVNSYGESAIGLHETETLIHLVHALWKHKVIKVSEFEAGLDDFHEVLGIGDCFEGYGLHNQIEMSDGLHVLLHAEKDRGDA